MDERKLQQVILLASAVLAVCTAVFLWSFGGEGNSLLSLLVFNGLFLLGACLICFSLGRRGASDASPVEDEAASLVRSRLQKYLRDESEEHG